MQFPHSCNGIMLVPVSNVCQVVCLVTVQPINVTVSRQYLPECCLVRVQPFNVTVSRQYLPECLFGHGTNYQCYCQQTMFARLFAWSRYNLSMLLLADNICQIVCLVTVQPINITVSRQHLSDCFFFGHGKTYMHQCYC